jgi:hypothetical protein
MFPIRDIYDEADPVLGDIHGQRWSLAVRSPAWIACGCKQEGRLVHADRKFRYHVNEMRRLPSVAYRESANKVKVDRIADEHILFFNVRLHSVVEYTEKPFDRVAFTQLSGDSKAFHGSWQIVPNQQGSTLRFRGFWEPDSLIPFFIIDHFAKNGLRDKFGAIAQLAEQRKGKLSNSCIN